DREDRRVAQPDGGRPAGVGGDRGVERSAVGGGRAAARVRRRVGAAQGGFRGGGLRERRGRGRGGRHGHPFEGGDEAVGVGKARLAVTAQRTPHGLGQRRDHLGVEARQIGRIAL